MSSHSAAMHGSSPGASQIEGLIREFDALRASIARARRIRNGLFLLALVFVLLACVIFYQLGSKLKSAEYRERLLAVAQTRFGGSNSTLYMNELTTLVNNAMPVITQAGYKQAKKDLPVYLRGVEKERDTFVADLREKLQTRLQDHYQKILDRHQATLQKEFPAAQDPKIHERVAANLHIVFEKMVKKYYVDDLNSEMGAFYDALDHFPAAESPGKGDVTLEDQFIGTLMEVLQESISK